MASIRRAPIVSLIISFTPCPLSVPSSPSLCSKAFNKSCSTICTSTAGVPPWRSAYIDAARQDESRSCEHFVVEQEGAASIMLDLVNKRGNGVPQERPVALLLLSSHRSALAIRIGTPRALPTRFWLRFRVVGLAIGRLLIGHWMHKTVEQHVDQSPKECWKWQACHLRESDWTRNSQRDVQIPVAPSSHRRASSSPAACQPSGGNIPQGETTARE